MNNFDTSGFDMSEENADRPNHLKKNDLPAIISFEISNITSQTLSEQPLIPPESTDSPNFPHWLHSLETCESTNSWAIARAAKLHHGDVIFTKQQTSGRGQHGRTWYSPPGVFTASFVLDNLNPNLLPGLSLAVGLAAIYAIEDLVPECRDMLRLKWPNDVWIHRQKLAGILCEATSDNTFGTRAVVGIGINRCVDFAAAGLDERDLGNAVSLHSIASNVPDELCLLARLRHYLLELADMFSTTDKPAQKSGLAPLLPELRRRDGLIGCNVAIELASETICGKAAGIDGSGRLLVCLAGDRIQAFTSGRVRLN
ncbi:MULTISPECIES: biotin--[acetyl-CoA-carboxylase] ligase [unclassified Tychonema]|uniref:biotin--[acetyl-CoA-carboxylase] ligase n=1 Tax=unclassified Tychonema TaxID=2642144 RepID=UPI001D14537E|nr:MULTISPECIES: biotin--[acetyl-CoA-carboxylase] ligase [unclassified Tychonema]